MRYLCLAYGDRAKIEAVPKDEWESLLAKIRVHDEELRKSGHFVSAESLEWDAMTIRTRNGKLATTDGPFIETKEQVGGLVIIEARDLNEAVRVASLHPAARAGEHLGWAIEVRPIAPGCHR
jgi:hypothetical protein